MSIIKLFGTIYEETGLQRYFPNAFFVTFNIPLALLLLNYVTNLLLESKTHCLETEIICPCVSLNIQNKCFKLNLQILIKSTFYVHLFIYLWFMYAVSCQDTQRPLTG
jgi:hypothetical protein